MSDWNTLSETDIIARFNPSEQAAYAALQGKDNIPAVVKETVAVIRGAIKAAGGQRGPVGTIPDSLKTTAVSLIIWLWITGYSRNDKLQTEGRKLNYQDAKADLQKVREGTFKVELPDAPDATSAPVNGIQVASVEKRQFTRRKLRGL